MSSWTKNGQLREISPLRRSKGRKAKGPATTKRLVDDNHKTVWTHNYGGLDQGRLAAADPACRHCHGTATPGQLREPGSPRAIPLVCICVFKRLFEDYMAARDDTPAGNVTEETT